MTSNPDTICGSDDLKYMHQFNGKNSISKDWVLEKAKTAVQSTSRNSACSGTMIDDDIYLTAAHCKHKVGDHVVFEYEHDQIGNKKKSSKFKINEVLEDGQRGGSLDYAIHRIEGAPGLKFGTIKPVPRKVEKGETLVIIAHPMARLKQVDVGPSTSQGLYLNHQVDTESGSSGAGVLTSKGELIAVHIAGGCSRNGSGSNLATPMTAIAKVSKIIKSMMAEF